LTEQLGTRFPQFYLTPPAPCPYLPGRAERKVFTKLTGPLSRQIHESLARVGFRRSQNIAYRPACDGCSACTSVRVLVDAFEPSRSFRKTMAANTDLTVQAVDPLACEEHYYLLKSYLGARHAGGGMAGMGVLDFVAMVEDTTIDTQIVEYRLPPESRGAVGELAACALTDLMSDGLSMVYSFFDPALSDRGLGTFMVLDHIERARKAGLPYVYLGYMVEECRKMAYKGRFRPLEGHGPDGWTPLKPR
jgi:arginyl-tRNA--protein-N-Asp/Glu arginylyltransferase